MSLSFAPLLPWVALAALAMAGLLLVGVAARARSRGWGPRALALTLLLGALANPVIRNQDRQPLPDIAVAVIDRSKSQTAGDRQHQTDDAEAALRAAVARLPNTELRLVTARSGTTDQDNGTRLFTALNQVLGDIPAERLAGAFFITDGQVHDVPDVASRSGLSAPLQVLLTGSKSEKDRRVIIDQAPRFGLVGKPQTLRFHLDDVGGDGSPVSVTLRIGAKTISTLMVTPGVPVEAPVNLDHAGKTIVEIVAPPMPGEISQANNRAVAIVEGIRDRLRVLLVSGEPHPGERTWRNLLKADASVDLVHFTILRLPDKVDFTPVNELSLIAFPTRELFVEKLDQFDLVIFDRYHREAALPDLYVQLIADYVRNGGALLLAAGPEFAEADGLFGTPLADVLPATPTGNVLTGAFRPAVTHFGERHPVTAALPGGETNKPAWGKWFRTVESNAAENQTLMSGLSGRPLLVLSHQGQGRTAQLLSDQSWLWARGYDGGGPQTELLRRLAHWLMKEPDLEEEALTGTQNGDTLEITRRTMADQAAPVTVTSPQGAKTSITLAQISPGRWRGQVPITEPGMYTLDDGSLQAVAAASEADAREAQDILATAAKLSPVAQATGGSVAWLEDGMPRLLKMGAGRALAGTGWMGLKDNGAYRVLAAADYPLSASLLALAALLLATSFMWYREGR